MCRWTKGSLHKYHYKCNTPINYTDPSGHWTQAIHKVLTEVAFKRVKNSKKSKGSLSKLLAGSVWPDIKRKINQNEKNRPWHGFNEYGGWTKPRDKQLRKAVTLWKNRKNYAKACEELGKGLHVIQDRLAHMSGIEDDAVNINLKAREKYRNATKIPANLKKYYGKVDSTTSASYVLADNPHAEYISGGTYGRWKFHGNEWENPRFKKARDTSQQYIEDFLKKAK